LKKSRNALFPIEARRKTFAKKGFPSAHLKNNRSEVYEQDTKKPTKIALRLGFQHNGYSHMRDLFQNTYVQIPRCPIDDRPECIAFYQNLHNISP